MPMDAIAHLDNLRSVLIERGWNARACEARGRTVLRVTNPAHPNLNDDIACQDDSFRWAWGQGIGPVTEVTEVADRIQHVLREVRG